VGKTRLALEAAAAVATEFPDGVWAVEFASVADPGQVPRVVAARLGLDLIVHINEDGLKEGVSPIASGSALHTHVMKMLALKQALDGLTLAYSALGYLPDLLLLILRP